jgi:hypothetical protein
VHDVRPVLLARDYEQSEHGAAYIVEVAVKGEPLSTSTHTFLQGAQFVGLLTAILEFSRK